MCYKESTKQAVQIIEGGNFIDHRGQMRFVNDCDISQAKRFYFIKHSDVETVRAWQGHLQEDKWFYPIKGSFVIAWAEINEFTNNESVLNPEHYIICAQKSEVVYIPKGHMNGLKALEPNSEILVFSNFPVTDSINEKIRFDADNWFDWFNLEPLSQNSYEIIKNKNRK